MSSDLPLNKIGSEPSMKDLLDIFKKDIFLSLNCHAIATVQSFDSAKQTVNATINYKKTFYRLDPKTNTYDQILIDYPVLFDCPIIALQGGKSSITFPILKGDTCLILFNDRDLDNWFKSGQIGPVNTQRLHSSADSIALVGLRAANNPISSYDGARVDIRNDKLHVRLSATKLNVQNDTGNLFTTLNSLLTDLTNLTAALIVAFGGATPSPGSPLAPASATAIAVIQTALGTVQTQLGELLE